MANNHSLKIVEVSRISPPPESSSPTSLPLTFFDILWLRFSPVQRLFLYQFPSLPSDTIVSNLKHSLSLTLQHYLPLAGNLVWPQNSPKPVIEFLPGDGVLLTVAESDADFDHLSGDGLREATDFHHLIPDLPASHDRVSVISLQITLFQNREYSIGITSHHAILDGKTSTSFMKSWAQICSNLNDVDGASYPLSFPYYERKDINDSFGLEEMYLKEWLSIDGPNNKSLLIWSQKTPPDSIRGSFKLNLHSLQKLKKWIKKNRKDQTPIHISSFTVAASYMWVCVAKAEGLRDSKKELGIAVDARLRLNPSLPMNYFGNCVTACIAIAERNELLGENGVIVAAEAISQALKSLEDGILNGAEKLISVVKSENKADKNEKMFGIAGSPRFEIYSADFGWGKPKKVEMISIDKTGAVSLSENRDGDGVEFGWVAKREIMERLTTYFAQGLEAL